MTPAPRNRIQSISSQLRLQTIVRLRWIAVAGQLLTVLGVHFLLDFKLPIGLCVAVIAASAWLNIFLRIRFPARHRLSTGLATLLLTYDILQLGLLLHLTGGIQNPFSFLIVAPVTVSAATLPALSTIALSIVALLTAGVVCFSYMPLPWPGKEGLELPLLYRFGMWSAILCALTFMGLYARRLSKEASQMTAALNATEMVLAREQKLHALDGLAAAAAHELGTPLATISLVAKELQHSLGHNKELSEDLSLLISQAKRCRAILGTLTQRGNDGDPLYDAMPIAHLIEEAIAPFRTFDKEIKLLASPIPEESGAASQSPIARRNPGVSYGLTNLIENAVDFAKTEVTIVAEWSKDVVAITIADDGPGFPPDILESIGEPYLTTRPASHANKPDHEPAGLGLGFFIAKTLLVRSGAQIDLANREDPETGALVRITWPRSKFEQGGAETLYTQSDKAAIVQHEL